MLLIIQYCSFCFSVGSSSILNHSYVLESSYGKRDILHLLIKRKQKRRCVHQLIYIYLSLHLSIYRSISLCYPSIFRFWIYLTYIVEYMKSCWLFLLFLEKKQSKRNLLEAIILQLLRLMYQLVGGVYRYTVCVV